MNINYIYISKTEKAFFFLRFLVILFTISVIIVPLGIVVFYAFNLNLIGQDFSLEKIFSNFIWLFQNIDLLTGIKNSIIRSVFTPLVTCFVCFFASYALAMGNGKFFKCVYIYTFSSLYFIAGPMFSYINMSSLSLTNSFWVYVLPYLTNSLYILILVESIKGIPKEYHEEARIDGANNAQIVWRIYIPALLPKIVAIYVLCFILHWNDYVDTLLYNFSNTDLYTIQYMSYAFANKIVGATTHHGSALIISLTSVKMAMTVLLIVPVIIIFPTLKNILIRFIRKF